MDTLEVLGKHIQELRTQKGKTQKEMAQMLEMTLRNYQRIEYGQINLQALTLCFLADYFEVTTDYLLGRSELCKTKSS